MRVKSCFGRGILFCLLVVILFTFVCVQSCAEGSTYFNLDPYFNQTFDRVKDNWTEYDGAWSIKNGMYNVNSGAGYKSILNNNNYSDFVYEADISTSYYSDSGLIFRVTNPAVGVDAYTGYYAGIDTRNGGIVLGKVNNNWTVLERYPISITPGLNIILK